MKLRNLLLGAATAGLLALPGAASAQLITEWDYSVLAAWDNWQPATDVNRFISGNEDVLEWGIPTTGGESNLRVTRQTGTALSGDTIFTNSGIGAAGATITHNNFPIVSGPSLESTDLVIDVAFTPTGGSGDELFEQRFLIDFEETLNQAGTCPPDSASVCDDIFILNNPGDLVVEFVRGGYAYTAELVFAGFSGGQIFFDDIDGDGIPELYFLTEENKTSVLSTEILITARPVSEPGALALIGAGLAGLGVAARRRRKAA